MKLVQLLAISAVKAGTAEGALQKLTDDSRTASDPFSDAETVIAQKAYELTAVQLEPDDSCMEKDWQADM
jgi:hypothetical protein